MLAAILRNNISQKTQILTLGLLLVCLSSYLLEIFFMTFSSSGHLYSASDNTDHSHSPKQRRAATQSPPPALWQFSVRTRADSCCNREGRRSCFRKILSYSSNVHSEHEAQAAACPTAGRKLKKHNSCLDVTIAALSPNSSPTLQKCIFSSSPLPLFTVCSLNYTSAFQTRVSSEILEPADSCENVFQNSWIEHLAGWPSFNNNPPLYLAERGSVKVVHVLRLMCDH